MIEDTIYKPPVYERGPENEDIDRYIDPWGPVGNLTVLYVGDIHLPTETPSNEPTATQKGVIGLARDIWDTPYKMATGESWYTTRRQTNQTVAYNALTTGIAGWIADHPEVQQGHFGTIFTGDLAADRSGAVDYAHALDTFNAMTSRVYRHMEDLPIQAHPVLFVPGDHDQDLQLNAEYFNQVAPFSTPFLQRIADGNSSILGINTNIMNEAWLKKLENLAYGDKRFQDYYRQIIRQAHIQRQLISAAKGLPNITVVGHQPGEAIKVAKQINANTVVSGHLHVPLHVENAQIHVPHTSIDIPVPYLRSEDGTPIHILTGGAVAVGRFGLEKDSQPLACVLTYNEHGETSVHRIPYGNENDPLWEVVA